MSEEAPDSGERPGGGKAPGKVPPALSYWWEGGGREASRTVFYLGIGEWCGSFLDCEPGTRLRLSFPTHPADWTGSRLAAVLVRAEDVERWSVVDEDGRPDRYLGVVVRGGAGMVVGFPGLSRSDRARAEQAFPHSGEKKVVAFRAVIGEVYLLTAAPLGSECEVRSDACGNYVLAVSQRGREFAGKDGTLWLEASWVRRMLLALGWRMRAADAPSWSHPESDALLAVRVFDDGYALNVNPVPGAREAPPVEVYHRLDPEELARRILLALGQRNSYRGMCAACGLPMVAVQPVCWVKGEGGKTVPYVHERCAVN